MRRLLIVAWLALCGHFGLATGAVSQEPARDPPAAPRRPERRPRGNAANNRERVPRIASAGELLDAGLSRRLANRASGNWKDVPLRSVLEDFGQTGDFAWQLDRRIDPDQLITAELRDGTLAEGLDALVSGNALSISRFGPLVYIGPAEAAGRLRTLAVLRGSDVAALPDAPRRKWLAAARWSWPRFSEPRRLVEQLARQAGVEVTGLERIPHDLWPATELPSLSAADRLTLVANQFDLTYRIDPAGLKAELIPNPEAIEIEKPYAGGSNPARLAELWQARAPTARIEVDGPRLIVRGRVEDHETIRQPEQPAKDSAHDSASRPSNTKRPSRNARPDGNAVRIARLEFKDLPLGGAIEGLAKRLQLQLEMDRPELERTGISFDQRVSVDLTDATLDEVWDAVLKDTGLSFRLGAGRIKILPR